MYFQALALEIFHNATYARIEFMPIRSENWFR
jgi:hypothetical protein